MAFQKQESITRVPHIRSITITIRKNIVQDDIDSPGGVRFYIRIEDQENELIEVMVGDLWPHLPASVKANLQSFMDWVWAKANDEVIG